MGVNIKGLNSLLSKITQLGGATDKVLDKALMKAGKQVEGDAKDLCPVDGGRLRNSINTQKHPTIEGAVTIGTNVEYAAYVEMGTGMRGSGSPSPPKYGGSVSYREDWSGMEAQPYLWPALNQNKEVIQQMVKEDLQKEIRRLGG